MTENANASQNKSVSKDVIEAVNLMAQGKRNVMCGEMSHAVTQLQEACQILGKEYGELADECADAYFWYGKALLEISRTEGGVLGDAIPGDSEESQSSDDEDEADEAAEQNSTVSENNSADGAENDSVASEDIENEETEAAEEKVDVKSTDPQPSTSDPQPSTSSGTANEEAAKQENVEDVSSLQLAWEMLELSKVIYKRHDSNEMKLKLADTYLKLGEIGLETEQYDQAISDLTECLQIQRCLLTADDRRLAETLYQLGLACTFDKRYDDAVLHYRGAIEVLETKIAQLRLIANSEAAANAIEAGSFETPAELAQKEIDELSSILPDLVAKIEDIEDERRNAAQVQWMMRESVATTSNPVSSRFGNGDGGFGSSSSSATPAFQSVSDTSSSGSSQPVVHNISHLVRKKRKSDSEDANSDAAKKLKTASETENGSSRVGDAQVEKASLDDGQKSGSETVKQNNGESTAVNSTEGLPSN